MRRAYRLHLQGGRDGVGDQFVDRYTGVADAIDEGSVGAVLEQAAHEVTEESLVRADRCVDAAGAIEVLLADHALVERFAHAVQALEFVLSGSEIGTGHLQDRRQGECIVRRELREHRVGRGEQFPCARKIGDVGVHLAREHRKVGHAIDLRALDLAVPVSALD